MAVNDVAEEPFARKVGRQKFVAVKATVLHKHNGGFGFFVRFDEFFTLFFVVCAAYFERDGNMSFHRVDRDFRVIFPRRRDEHRVKPRFVEHFFMVGVNFGFVTFLF